MTELDGPPGPALRFSSLLIRGAETASVAGADPKGLEVNCNMAQAFEIPTGQPDSASSYPVTAGGRPPRDTQQEIPSNAFQIAAPGPIQRRTGQWNMGPVSDRRKRINAALPDPQPGP